MRAPKNILHVMTELFGSVFRGESWSPWRAPLAALFSLSMTEEQLALYRRCTGREHPPRELAREAWWVIGRRGGKSRIAALVAVFLACFVKHTLAPGESGVVMVIAADRKQARVVLRYVLALLRAVPMLARLIENETKEAVELSNGIAIEVHTASFRSTRGYTIIAAILDEVAYWPTEDAAEPDSEVIAALRPGMATVPDALLLAISSPYARGGELWNAYQRHYGRVGDPVQVWQADSRTMNPSLPERVIRAAYEEDEARAAAEFGAQFRRDVEMLFSPDALAAVTVKGRRELPPAAGLAYRAFVDPSGGAADSMTLAIAHGDSSGRRALDAVREKRPPFSPEAVVEEFAALLREYRVIEVVGDKYAGEWPRERFQKAGIAYRVAERTKSELYGEFLPLVTSVRVELLEDERLLRQLARLERRTARSGRDSIDHALGGHDDVANAAAGALVLARPGVEINLAEQAFVSTSDEFAGAVHARCRELEFQAGRGAPWDFD